MKYLLIDLDEDPDVNRLLKILIDEAIRLSKLPSQSFSHNNLEEDVSNIQKDIFDKIYVLLLNLFNKMFSTYHSDNSVLLIITEVKKGKYTWDNFKQTSFMEVYREIYNLVKQAQPSEQAVATSGNNRRFPYLLELVEKVFGLYNSTVKNYLSSNFGVELQAIDDFLNSEP